MRAPAEDALHPSEPEDATETSRQRLRRWLEHGKHDFETLRDALALGVRELERELRHVARSVRREGRRLAVEEARCRDCDFVFAGRSDRHLHPPGRCPRCRSQRIAPPRFRLAGSGR